MLRRQDGRCFAVNSGPGRDGDHSDGHVTYLLGALRPVAVGAVLMALAMVVPLRAGHSVSMAIESTFALTGTDGRTVTDRDFRGKWMIVYFGYTFCPDICPTTLAEITNALSALGPQAAKFQPIFITVDPARDLQRVLAEYLKSFGSRFVGLRGDAQTTQDVARQFHAYFRLRSLASGQYTVDHSSFVYVFDPDGKFVAFFAGDTRADALADALRNLLK